MTEVTAQMFLSPQWQRPARLASPSHPVTSAGGLASNCYVNVERSLLPRKRAGCKGPITHFYSHDMAHYKLAQ